MVKVPKSKLQRAINWVTENFPDHIEQGYRTPEGTRYMFVEARSEGGIAEEHFVDREAFAGLLAAEVPDFETLPPAEAKAELLRVSRKKGYLGLDPQLASNS